MDHLIYIENVLINLEHYVFIKIFPERETQFGPETPNQFRLILYSEDYSSTIYVVDTEIYDFIMTYLEKHPQIHVKYDGCCTHGSAEYYKYEEERNRLSEKKEQKRLSKLKKY